MNICIITGSFLPEIAGVPVHLYNLTGHLSRMGHKVLMLCPDFSIVGDIYPDFSKYLGEIFSNVIVKPVPTKPNMLKRESIDYKDKSLWSLEEYIGDFKPQIIQVEDPARIYGLALFGLGIDLAYNGVIGLDYARANDIPIIGFYHSNFGAFADTYIPQGVSTPYRDDPAGVYRKVYGSYDEILCSCEDAFLHLKFHGLERIRQGLYIGINESVFAPDGKSHLVPGDDTVKILYSGRFDGGKDIKTVIEIFSKAFRKDPKIRLYLAGTGLFRETMEYLSAECRDNPGIVYLGSLEVNELVKVYNSVDIYFSPHKNDTFGLSVIEAMSKGLPVIAANQGGPLSLIDNGSNGILCANEDEFVRYIDILANDTPLRQTLGKKARETAKKYYGKNCASNLVDTYNGLISS